MVLIANLQLCIQVRETRFQVVDYVINTPISRTASRLLFKRAKCHRNLCAKDLEPHGAGGRMIHFGILSGEEDALVESFPEKVYMCG